MADDPLITHAQLLAEARKRLAAAEKEAAKWRRLVTSIEGELAAEESFVLGEALTISHERSKVTEDMQAAAYTPHAKKAGRPVESGHPFALALKRRKMSVRQWADAHKIGRAKAASWMVNGDGGRRIPRKYAEEIAHDFKVPLSAWSNGIRED